MIVGFGNNIIDTMSTTGPVRYWDCGVTWADIQPTENTWDWTELDALVAASGTRPKLLVLGHPAAWAAKGGSDGLQAAWLAPGSNRPPKTDAIWAQYVVAVATRYKGVIQAYQVWNEPVDKRFYTGTYDELAFYTKRAYSLIRRTDPGAKLVSPPLQPRQQAGWTTKGMALFTALKNQSYPFDVWAAHIYPQIGEGVPALTRDVKLVKTRISVAQKPLWITECNFNLGGTGNPYAGGTQTTMLNNVRTKCYELDIPRVYWYGFGHSQPSLFAITNTGNL